MNAKPSRFVFTTERFDTPVRAVLSFAFIIYLVAVNSQTLKVYTLLLSTIHIIQFTMVSTRYPSNKSSVFLFDSTQIADIPNVL
jgi:hypothetical protein